MEVANQKANISSMNRRMAEFYSFAAGAVQVISRRTLMAFTINYKYEMTRCKLRALFGQGLVQVKLAKRRAIREEGFDATSDG
jgi:hypothetical protein